MSRRRSRVPGTRAGPGGAAREPRRVGEATAHLLRWRGAIFREAFGREIRAGEPVFFDLTRGEPPVEMPRRAIEELMAAWFEGRVPDYESVSPGLSAENARVFVDDLSKGFTLEDALMRSFRRAGVWAVP